MRARLPELVSYLSGGNPVYVAETLAGTAVWRAILGAWRSGAALGGLLGRGVRLEPGGRRLRPAAFDGQGLAVVPRLVVSSTGSRTGSPGSAASMLARSPPDAVLVGIDEATALVGGATELRRS